MKPTSTYKKRVVVIHRSRDWLSSSSRLLLSEGYRADSFVSLRSALSHLATPAALVVADYSYVRSMGRDWSDFRREVGAETKILLFISSRSPSLARSCFLAGADDCAVKPETDDELRTLVRNAIGPSNVKASEVQP